MVSEDSDYEGFFKVNDVEFMGDNSKMNDLEVMGNNSKKKKKKKKKKVVEGAPLYDDFDNVNRSIKFLKIFYDVTIKLSGSKYCTSNVFFVELVKVQESIIKLCSSENILMRDMALSPIYI
ncbi:hypothetical protein POM88_013919 [Heracleum sosnowskyi]|uniref:Uncharacterized protein n=1 Tax=Heracleum sosnowskyi TaxID=360622 RepID=A0AAD8N4V7_9APIA|nr:hypothetical protein POM88_013919 [Heracleum sosnowskyi]